MLSHQHSRTTASPSALGVRHQAAWVALLGAGALIGGFFWMASPGINLASSRTGLAAYRLSGLSTAIAQARFDSHPLGYGQGRFIPTNHLSAGTQGNIQLTIQGPPFLRWLPWETRTVTHHVTVPRDPKPTARGLVARPLGSTLPLQFNEPVVRVIYRTTSGQSKALNLSTPSRLVHIPLGNASPGQSGTVWVSGQSRLWEQTGPLTPVRWHTVPYIVGSVQGTSEVQPTGVLHVAFSQPIRHPHWSSWTFNTSVKGQWHEVNAKNFTFTPSGPTGFGPGARVQLTIPAGAQGPEAQSGSVLRHAVSLSWTTPAGSVLRLQQLLAEEGYLPVSWTPDGSSAGSMQSEVNTIYQPPSGTFNWKYSNLPSQLHALWAPGQMTAVTQGAIMQFERANGLPVDGIAGPLVWQTLLRDRLEHRSSPWPYTYIFVTETSPETLELWTGNHLTMKILANTGIPATPTYLGTFPIYERLKFQIMRGKNPNGVPYADPVYWINYFKGGDAVHGFVRSSYGFPQSLGCVEVPPSEAQQIYPDVHYGTLVTVNPVGVLPAPASATGK